MLVSLYIGDVFGGRAIELAGRVIKPEYQGSGIGSAMLKKFVHEYRPAVLTTYTRNPSIIKMIHTISKEVYPIVKDDTLRYMATEMPYAQGVNSVVYHINRYDEAGLFQGFDPAERPILTNGQPLKEQFLQLQNIRSALVIAARINLEALR